MVQIMEQVWFPSAYKARGRGCHGEYLAGEKGLEDHHWQIALAQTSGEMLSWNLNKDQNT